MSWEVAFKQWSECPYPSCPSEFGDVDLVLQDASLAAHLIRLRMKRNAFVEFKLIEIRQTLLLVLPRLSDECLAYFVEAVEVVNLALEERTP